MRFLFLIHGDGEAEAALSADERRAIVGEHIAYGVDAARARRVRARRGAQRRGSSRAARREADRHRRPVRRDEGGRRRLLRRRCASREEALELAGRVPQSPGVAVEVLTVADV